MAQWHTINSVLGSPGLPSRRTLYDWTKRKPAYKFLKLKAGEWHVDMEHPGWLERLAKYQKTGKVKGTGKRAPGRQAKIKKALNKTIKPSQAVAAVKIVFDPIAIIDQAIMDASGSDKSEDMKMIPTLLKERMALEKLQEEVLEKRFKRIAAEKKMHKEDYNLIEWTLAKFLFFGYFIRFNTELLKLADKLETPVKNMVAEGNWEGIIKRFQREHESMIREIKKSQAKDVADWKEENAADI